MKLSKNPVVNGILNAVVTAALFSAVVYVLSLIKKVPFAEQYNTFLIVCCAVGSVWSGIQAYMSTKKGDK